MRDEVAVEAPAIAIVLSPAVEILSPEWDALFYFAEPTLPIDIFRLGFLFDEIIPFARNAVSAVKALAPYQGAEFTAFDEVGALMPDSGGTPLGADLINL